MHILLIEDDQIAATYLTKGLTESGHTIERTTNGEDGLRLALTENYDVLIVDRMLPGRDGLSIIRTLRSKHIQTPALVLSALGEVDDRVEGLRAGGDDYLVKPYAFSELLARLDAIARREAKLDTPEKLTLLDLELDLVKHKVTRAGQLIRLQPREMRLLEYFMRQIGQTITRTMLLEQVWDLKFDPKTSVIDTQVSRLRAKIDKDFEPPLLHTIRGVGYKLDEFS
ncbi:MAG: response regulator [Thiotrichales bacterium]